MEERDADSNTGQRSSWRRVWQHIATALMLALLVHQLAMAMPFHTAAPAMAATDLLSNITMPCDGSCPSGIITLCIPGRVCAGVEAALTRLPFTPLLLVEFLILALLALRPSFVALRHPRWLWPPDRRRALLQVFLI
jgi:hypothetical protein